MTHDPREALEPCPFCGGGNVILSHKWDYGFIRRYPYCNGCGARGPSFNGEEEERAWLNTRILTALPGEQKPVAYQYLVDGEWKECSAFVAKGWSNELSPGTRALYTSPPPAAGWNEAIEVCIRELQHCRDHGHEPDITTIKKLKALRREAPAPDGVAEEARWEVGKNGWDASDEITREDI